MPPQYIVGIDLGTTNSVLAYASLAADAPEVHVLPIPQLVAPGTVDSRSTLPSFLYLATEAETGTLDLPWADGQRFAVGEVARKRSAEAPDRTVVGAKSWLAHSLVDRRQAILPWNAPPRVEKISPVEASRRYLEHLVAAWTAAFPDAPLIEQEVVLTVPASFDASARELTREAAIQAGLPEEFILLEEPQAAVYAWLGETGDGWRRILKVGDLLLVCDVGGGTSDFTLVSVAEESGELVLNRVAVGNHLLVGGDNMDLALAHHVAGLFAEKGVKLDPWQSVSLWHSCRQAKETLLASDGPATTPIAVLGRGSKLIGGTVSVDVAREQVGSLLLDGFVPQCQIDDRPATRRASGFQDIGLPYEADPSITKHLASFLARQGTDGQPAQPTRVLFNGGVFKSPTFSQRLLDVVASWFGGDSRGRKKPSAAQPSTLNSQLLASDLDHAVAKGATHYGWSKRRGGVRIRGGTARSYYVGIETSGLAIPGAPRPLRAVCVVPFGMEEGTEADVPGAEVGLVVGEPAHFRFFNSSTRKSDQPGDVLSSWTEEELAETDSMEATLDRGESDEGYVPVRFQSKITELGVMELWCVSSRSDRKWKLEFSVRDDAGEVV
ncbi:MAG: Hsp70 family protein [Planctomycetaceae bacterium]|nr:Hsp70 family protein [Planctomycetaceae bacterium]